MSSQDEIRETVCEPSVAPSLSDDDLAEALGGVIVTGGSGETVIKTASSSECGVRDNTEGRHLLPTLPALQQADAHRLLYSQVVLRPL